MRKEVDFTVTIAKGSLSHRPMVIELQKVMMTGPRNDSKEPLHLDAKGDGDRLVVLTPDDEDRFVRSCKWIVEASKLSISRDLWLRELHGLLSHVRQWIMKHEQSVRASYATFRDEQIAIFVVPMSGRYDFSLSEQLTELDVELAEKFQACPCDILQTPDKPFEELEEMTGRGIAILIYGDNQRTQKKVAP